MASIFLKDPVYITVEEVRDSTQKTALASLTDNQIKVLIYKAQKEVDAYLGRTFFEKYDKNQEFLFPTSKDGQPFIPSDIKEATLYVVEQLFESGDTVKANIGGGQVIRETTGPHSIEYAEGVQFTGIYVPDIAKKLLDKYKRTFFTNVI